MALFQSTPPHGGRLALDALWGVQVLFQSTPPHGGRPGMSDLPPRLGCFNPRPRTGGDLERKIRVLCARVSIHAPARGATFVQTVQNLFVSVSIHAPARGATGEDPSSSPVRMRFNPRPRTGGDLTRVPLVPVYGRFQSTPPHGGRLKGGGNGCG